MSKDMRARKCAPALVVALAALAVALVTVPVASYAAEGASSDMSGGVVAAESEEGTAEQEPGVEGSQPEHPKMPAYTLYTVEHCPQCNGASHEGWSDFGLNAETIRSIVGADTFRGEVADATSSNPTVLLAYCAKGTSLGNLAMGVGEVPGTATMTITSTEGDTVEAQVTVKDVSDDFSVLDDTSREELDSLHYQKLEGFQLGNGDMTLELSEGATYLGYGMNSNAYVKIDYQVADSSIVEVVQDGAAIRPLKVGSTTVTATAHDLVFGGTQTSTIKVVVVDGEQGSGQTLVIRNESGATVEHPATPEWNDVRLETQWLGGDTAQTATNSLVAAVEGVTGHPYVYDIHLRDAYGFPFEIPDGESVTVTLPIPEGLSAEGLHVFHVADDGTVTDMNATVDAEAGTVSFTTTHFSTFVLANVKTDDGGAGGGSGEGEGSGEKTADKLAATGDAGSAAALLAAASGSMALLGARVLRKRR